MMPRLRNWWYHVTGTDAQPTIPVPLPRVRAAWTVEQMDRYQDAIHRQLQYVDTELETLRRVVETPYDGKGTHDADR
jgi:hypothetical protein